MAGRVMPLAREFGKMGHDVHVLGLNSFVFSGKATNLDRVDSPIKSANDKKTTWHCIGREPFERTKSGKRRLAGVALVFHLTVIALKTTVALYRVKPDVVIIVKTLPHNVMGVWLWSWVQRPEKIIADVDDFELTANKLTSFGQRAAVHWAERIAVSLADVIVTATPFVNDHFLQLARGRKPVQMIPTGINGPLTLSLSPNRERGRCRFGYIGSVSVGSGHRVDWLPEIMGLVSKKYPEAVCIMVGSGDDEEKLRQMFKERKLENRVRWLGRFTEKDVPEILSQIDVLVDPVDTSIINRAKSSYRVMLALAYSLPVVTSNVGIRPILLPRKMHERLFAWPSDANDYAKKVVGLLEKPLDTSERNIMNMRAKKFSWYGLAQKYIKLIES